VVSGFQPGFPYLGGLPERLAMPRHAEPRLRVPAGSVGIGGAQTGVYPLATPGGWQLLGRTPLALFDPCVRSRCCCVPAIECALCRKRRGMLKMIRAGMYSSVQDGGREGQRQSGSVSAARWINRRW
jgi:hypothetical protein